MHGHAQALPGIEESCERSSAEICVEHTSAAISNHVEWTHSWICSHWQARGKCFEQHEAKGVGQTWEHEYVGTRVGGNRASRRAFRRRNAHQESASESFFLASPSPTTTFEPGRSSDRKASRFFSIATRAQVRKIGLGNSKMLAARGRKRLQSTPCDQRIQRTKPRVPSSRPSVSVRHHHARASICGTDEAVHRQNLLGSHSSRSEILGEARVVASRKGASGSAASEPCA